MFDFCGTYKPCSICWVRLRFERKNAIATTMIRTRSVAMTLRRFTSPVPPPARDACRPPRQEREQQQDEHRDGADADADLHQRVLVIHLDAVMSRRDDHALIGDVRD